MMRIKKKLLEISPYFASILAGLVFLFIGLNLSPDIKGLFISISATFFAIPLIYLCYQVAQNNSQKRLRKEAFEYRKMEVDREILSIINQLQKIVYPLEERNFSTKGINEFLSIGKRHLKEVLSKNEYLGFQIFKKWEVSEDNLHKVLENSSMLKRLQNEQITSIISIIKSLRSLESTQQSEELYASTNKKATSYKIVRGKELNEKNIKFPDRYLLLKDLGDNTAQVADFGDFPPYNISKLLQIFTLKEKYLETFSSAILDLIGEINIWVDLTGGEFIIDTEMFRLGYKVKASDS